MKKLVSVAIDGPSGAGKSTLAKRVAADLGYLYVDTGAIYRSIGYYAFINGIAPENEAEITASLSQIALQLVYSENGLQHMILNDKDVTEEIRLPEISQYASAVSAHKSVRAFLLEMQRDFAKKHDVIMDGRDIGTVVLPDATVKIFLTATAEIRAQRRCRELFERGTPQPFETILREMEERDYQDSHRALAPLCAAKDAIVVDTTELSFEQSRKLLLDTIEENK